MKTLILGCLLIVVTAVSCRNNNIPEVSDPGISYFTMDSGTIWNYESYNNIDSIYKNYILTATGTDTTISSKVYRIFTHVDTSGATSLEFYNTSVNNYFQFAKLSSQIPATELKYLVNNVDSGASWEQTLNITQVQAGITVNFIGTLKYTIETKGDTITVGNNFYTNVIKVRTEIINPTITSSLGIPISVEPITQNMYAYFAPKYGLVKREFQLNIDINILGSIQNVVSTNISTNLLSSSIQ